MSKKRRNRNKGKKKQKNKFFSVNTLKKIFLFLLILCFVVLLFWRITLPKVNDETFYIFENQTTIYDQNGEYVTSLSDFGTTWVNLDEISPIYIESVLSIEDDNFYSHNGVNFLSLIRATFGQIFNTSDSGASTITMQLAKLIYLQSTTEVICETIDGEEVCTEEVYDLRASNPIKYKASQIMLALQIDRKYDKKTILEYYVNIVYFGDGIYGVENASNYFFDKSSSELTLAEASLLAGIPQNPYANNPYYNPEDAKIRQDKVIEVMILHEDITAEEGEIVINTPLEDIILEEPNISSYSVFAGYIDVIYREMKQYFGEDFKVASSGAQIYTNLDVNVQETIYNTLNNSSQDYLNFPELMQSGAIVLDTDSSAIVGVGNGIDYESILGINYAVNYPRQPGSTAKPLTAYAPAIEYLNWGSNHGLVDSPISYTNGPSIRNFDGNYRGAVTMEYALANSRNTTALFTYQQVAASVGQAKIGEFMKNLGISDSDNLNEAYSIGGWAEGITPLELSAAYAAFGNGGTYNQPHAINYVTFSKSSPYYEEYGDKVEFDYNSNKAMNEGTAFIISDMLDPNNYGSITQNFSVSGTNMSIKTGSSTFEKENNKGISENITKDHWTVGYTPEYTTAVWTGFTYETESTEYNLGPNPSWSGRIFKTIMSDIVTNESYIEYEVPDDVIPISVGGKTYYAPKDSKDAKVEQFAEIGKLSLVEEASSLNLSWSYNGENRADASWDIYINNKLFETTKETSIAIPYSKIVTQFNCLPVYTVKVVQNEVANDEEASRTLGTNKFKIPETVCPTTPEEPETLIFNFFNKK